MKLVIMLFSPASC